MNGDGLGNRNREKIDSFVRCVCDLPILSGEQATVLRRCFGLNSNGLRKWNEFKGRGRGQFLGGVMLLSVPPAARQDRCQHEKSCEPKRVSSLGIHKNTELLVA